MKPLQGKIALVAGATRGTGRGIACMLGEAGATVYCTGRSVRGAPATAGRPETIEETAERVTDAGGEGVWVRVDHTVEDEVRELFDRVREERGRLDVLVNDIWGGDELTEWSKPFWELSLAKGFLMLDRAIRSHIITSRYGVPLMLEGDGGLVVEVTDGDDVMNRHYRGHLFYDLCKVSAIRLAFAMAQELRDRPVTAVALTPGYLRSEAMLDHFGVTEETWRDAIDRDPNYAESETPCYAGRAVAALAADVDVKAKSGQALSTWSLAKEYGFRDIDGRQPDWGRHFERIMGESWSRLVGSVDEVFRAEGGTTDVEFDHDFARLELRASGGSARCAWRLMVPELLMSAPAKLASEFHRRYRREGERGSV